MDQIKRQPALRGTTFLDALLAMLALPFITHLDRFHAPARYQKSDDEALYDDWLAVGLDIQSAINSYANEHKNS